MTPQETFSYLINLVPHWYQAEHAPKVYSTTVGDETFTFASHRRLTPKLQNIWCYLQSNLDSYIELGQKHPASIRECVEETVVEKWLSLHDPETDWKKLLRYVHTLRFRTCENMPVGVNVVLSGGTGTTDLTRPQLMKLVDQIANSPFTFIRCDKQLNCIAYEEIEWANVANPTGYTFYPDFLHPFACLLQQDSDAAMSIHITSNRDVIVMNKEGLVASYRKGSWRIYDPPTFKNAIVVAMGDYWVGCNLFGVLFDLSFKRHGALLVYDPDSKVRQQIANESNSADGLKVSCPMIANAIATLSFGDGSGDLHKKRRTFAELASIDGAIIFRDKSIDAIGALINQHSEAGDHIGARTTAAVSAMKWGGFPVKVSSDGDVTVYFKSKGPDGEVDATLNFA